MLAIDNGNADTAELILAISLILALFAAVFYVLADAKIARLAPVALSLAVGALALAWWVA